MRIAMFSDNFYPELSGLADSIMTSARELGKRGHHIEFYVPRYSEKDYEVVGLPNKEIDLGERVSIVRLSSFHGKSGTGQGRAVIPTWFRWHQVQKFNPDIIHTHLFFGTGIEALVAAKKLKKPLVGTNHTALKEDVFLPYTPLHSKKLVEFIIKYIIWYYNKCLFVTAPSRVVIDDMRLRGLRREAHVLPNPIDTDLFRALPNKNWLKSETGWGEQVVIHAGRLATERSVDVILRAIALVKKEIPDVRLVLAGKGASEKELKKLAEVLKIKSNVSFVGFLEKPKLAEAYNVSRIFVITSTADTQSMVMMQAMACGLPIIAVKEGGPAEYINKNNGFLIERGDEKTLSKKIIFLLTHNDVRKKVGENARKFAIKFSAPEIAKEWEMIYEKIIKDYNQKK